MQEDLTMANVAINIKRLVETIRKTNVYTPIIEAIVNSIDAIDDAHISDGDIKVTLVRHPQEVLKLADKDGEENEIPYVTSVKVTDNGIGFTDDNVRAFDYIYTENKANKGGKGFGRFVYLKYFRKVNVSSVFQNNGNKHKRTFDFIKADQFTTNRKVEDVEDSKPCGTEVLLDKLYDEHLPKLDKKLDTISRKLLENLLVFFTLDDYTCPKITIYDEYSGESVILNDLIDDKEGISEILAKEIELNGENEKETTEKFKAKVFKVYYSQSRSSIALVANQRQVTDTALYDYVTEFKDDFFDRVPGEKGEFTNKNYTVKVYVTGKYLDENVSDTRDSFHFPKSEKTLYHQFCQRDIEKLAANIAKEALSDEVKLRREKKISKVREYVNATAPQHRIYADKLDYALLPFDPNEAEIESALQNTRFHIETKTKNTVEGILKNSKFEITDKFYEAVNSLTELGKSELSHYVILRRLVLDLFKKSLTWNDDQKYSKEKVIHDIIFPTRCDSDSIPYDEHNLWIVDEKLCFHEYLASDKPLNTKDERPDLVIFNNKITLRSGDEASNPIVVVEFKKPQREEYTENDNPLKQIAGYIDKIRRGQFKTPEGRTLNVNENTPAFGYLICDLTDKIHSFCKDYDLTMNPDNQGYFGFHKSHKIYFEVISFDKLVKDAEQRNRVFFKKLHIE